MKEIRAWAHERMSWLVSPSKMTPDDEEFIDSFVDKVLEACLAVVPEEIERFGYEGPFNDGQRDGWNDMRTQVIERIKGLGQ